ncbi:MAG: nucleotidyltransferase family protein [Anaerolineae bacterium]|nr:nucleotidyltransferase family protein [Anaerolineae bacterium]
MKPEDNLLFILARQNFLETHRQKVLEICRTEPIDWENLQAIALAHGIMPLVYVNLQNCPVAQLDLPAEVEVEFKSTYHRNLAQKTGTVEMLRFILDYLNRYQIDVMLIKGGALDQLVYDNLAYTLLNDIDLVLRPRYGTLSSQQRETIEKFFVKIPSFRYDFFEHYNVTLNGSLAVDFDRIWRDADQISILGETALVMSPEDMLIVTCINSCRNRFFKLKSLCDIAETIEKYQNLNWAEFVRKTKDYECRNIVYAALVTTQLTLGCHVPDTILARLDINPIRAELIQFLSRRMSLSSLYTLQASHELFGRYIGLSLLLPYVTYQFSQVRRKLPFMWHRAKSGRPVYS